MPRFVISGGDFRRNEGCLSVVDLDEATGLLTLCEETWISHPRPHLAVLGKGITGLWMDGETAWVCFSNLIARVALSGEVLELIEDESFNDLHQLSMSEVSLVLANTGNESVDFISLDNRSISRFDLLGSDLRGVRHTRSQNEDTKPHLHHLASACVNADGDLVLGLGRQARILNATKWSWLGPRMRAPVHDVHCSDDGAVWCTTVEGAVHRIGPRGEVQTWSLIDHQQTVGWTRGLAVKERGLLVGTTAIRDSNRGYYQSLVPAEASNVGACLTWVPFAEGSASTMMLPGGSTRKVFSIRELISGDVGEVQHPALEGRSEGKDPARLSRPGKGRAE